MLVIFIIILKQGEFIDAYQDFSKILDSDQWGKRIFLQNQQTYVVCLNQIPDSQDQLEEIDPLEQLIQSTIKKNNTRRPQKKVLKVNGVYTFYFLHCTITKCTIKNRIYYNLHNRIRIKK